VGASSHAPGAATPGTGARPLRILYVTPRYLPERGGTEVHTSEVARRMAERGAEVGVLTTFRGPEPPPEEEDGGAVPVRRVRAWPRRSDYFFAPSLPSAIRAARPDLVHCQSYHTFVAPMTMLTALRASIPYVVTLHSGGHASRMRMRLRPLHVRLLRPLLLRARALIAVSAFEADLFARRLGVAPERFTVIPSGIDLPPVANPAPPVDPTLILSIGRLESYKGHDRVIAALPALRRRRPGTRLRIVGSGPYEAQLRLLASRLGVADAVVIEPIAGDDRGKLAELLSRTAVVTALSEYESQGLAVQEAIGLGRPVVVTEGSALDELAGYPSVVTVAAEAGADDVADAVSRVLDAAPAPAPALQTWDACAAALWEVYGAVLGSGADASAG
jgi:glycosyltransferase involved in cell wall biosynthesis